MQSDKYVYMGPVRYDRPDYSAMSMRELGAAKALEHPLMARQFEVAQTVRTVQAVPDAQLGPGAMSTPNMLQSIIQRPNEHVYIWTPTDSSDPLPLWLVRAITEAVDTPDLRVMRDPGDPTRGRLYRRAVGDRFLWEEPVSWVPVPDLRIAYGGSSRETVPGVDSWLTFSLMKTQEEINGVKLPRPTDQRYSVGLYFQDYVPRFPKYKFSLRAIFADGLPVGSPRKGRQAGYFRAPAYKRVDIGASRILVGGEDKLLQKGVLRHLKSVWIGIDVFNLFDISNVNSYYWVTDITNAQYAVPNYLTRRQINLRLSIDF